MQSATELEKLSREVFSQQIQCMLPNRSHHHYLQMYKNVVIHFSEMNMEGEFMCSDLADGTLIK